MKRTPLRTAVFAVLLGASTAAMTMPATALSTDSQLHRNVSRELPHYVPGVDVDTLSSGQLAEVYMIMHTNDSSGNKIRMIKSVLGGQHSLRGLLFNRNR